MKLSTSVLALVVLSSAAQSAEYGGDVAVRELLRATTTADGRPIRYLATTTPEVTAVLVTLPPGGETGWHHHPVPVYAYILEGTLEIQLESGEVHVRRAGDAWIEVIDANHNGRAIGGKAVKLVAFYTGEQGTPNTVMRD